MDPKIIGAFGLLSMCCICSSIVSGAMSGGTVEETAPPVVPVPKYRYVKVVRTKENDNHYMNLAEVEVFSDGVNVASGKTVTASSLFSNKYPLTSLVDGDKSNFSSTKNSETEYFDIDLGQAYEIEKVVITNRADRSLADGRTLVDRRAQNVKIKLSESADMTSSKDSRAITLTESLSDTFTWDVASDTLTAILLPGAT